VRPQCWGRWHALLLAAALLMPGCLLRCTAPDRACRVCCCCCQLGARVGHSPCVVGTATVAAGDGATFMGRARGTCRLLRCPAQPDLGLTDAAGHCDGTCMTTDVCGAHNVGLLFHVQRPHMPFCALQCCQQPPLLKFCPNLSALLSLCVASCGRQSPPGYRVWLPHTQCTLQGHRRHHNLFIMSSNAHTGAS
jgi:hypothetical protein